MEKAQPTSKETDNYFGQGCYPKDDKFTISIYPKNGFYKMVDSRTKEPPPSLVFEPYCTKGRIELAKDEAAGVL